jgi:ferric enterobactin receptor
MYYSFATQNLTAMKKFNWLIAMLTLSLAVHAQAPGGAPAGGAPAGARQQANVGHIYGKVLDNDGKPLPYTSVIVFQMRKDSTGAMKEKLLKGAMTQNNGDFSLEELPVFGPLVLKISATGFKQYTQNITFINRKPGAAPAAGSGKPAGAPGGAPGGGMPSFDKDLGNIKMSSDISQLQGVTVTAKTPAMTIDMDKKVYNVEQDISATGGTAQDVMKNVPSVNVDIDGNMTLRNSAPQLYVDGRPTTLTLDQIPADAIQNVEVMTAPSAKYDASGGGAGIVNIVLKKNKKTGYNGSVRAGVDAYGGYNGGVDLSYRQGKFNINGSFNGHAGRDHIDGVTDRLDFSTDPNVHTIQDNTSRTKGGGFMFGRLGLDYYLTNRTTLSLTGMKVHGNMQPDQTLDINSDTLYNSGMMTSFSRRITSSQRTFNANGLELDMTHNFPHEGEQLDINGKYFGGTSDFNSLYNTNYYDVKGGAVTGNELQKILGGGKMHFITAQADYTMPFTSTMKLEAGLRANMRHLENDNENYIYDGTAKEYTLIPNPASHYRSNDNVYAAYATFGNNIHDFGYKVGLRAESSDYEGTLIQTGQKFKNNYPISLFPTIFLSQKLKHDQELQVSLTRRINRPNFFQLIPFADSTDKLNITKGNPNLVPEFTNSVELNYLKTFKGGHTLMGTLYYKYTNNTITSYIDKQVDPSSGDSALINTYINAAHSYTTGAELTMQDYFTKWWDMTTNINVYNGQVKAGTAAVTTQPAMWSWFGKLNSNFHLPLAFDLQATGTYQSKTALPVNTQQDFGGGPPNSQAQSSSQGYIRSSWGVDLALKKSFMKSKALTATVAINDIFRTRITDQYAYSAYFVQNYTRLRNPQLVKLTIAYRFGKIDATLFKKKGNKANDNSGMDGMQQ